MLNRSSFYTYPNNKDKLIVNLEEEQLIWTRLVWLLGVGQFGIEAKRKWRNGIERHLSGMWSSGSHFSWLELWLMTVSNYDNSRPVRDRCKFEYPNFLFAVWHTDLRFQNISFLRKMKQRLCISTTHSYKDRILLFCSVS